MALYLGEYRQQAKEAIKAFWGNREAARQEQIELGKLDTANRGAVVGGSNLDGFRALVIDLVQGNGLGDATIYHNKGHVVLPGFYRATKQWDTLVFNGKKLVAALEFKSQVGSLGNNFNNRSEEAIGTAECFRVAHREHPVLKTQSKPFLGWLTVVEDSSSSRKPVRNEEPHFMVFPEFRGSTGQGASYLERYDILCQRLVREGLYDAAALLATPPSAVSTGSYCEFSQASGLDLFVAKFAAHIAAEAALPRPGPAFPESLFGKT